MSDQKQHRSLVAATVIAITYLAVAASTMPHDDPAGIADGVNFVASTLGDEAAGDRRIRGVHPSYAGISSWISAVGAGVTLADLDSDGLPNDACHVDPRNDCPKVVGRPSDESKDATGRK